MVITERLPGLTSFAGSLLNPGWMELAIAGQYEYSVGTLLPGAAGFVDFVVTVDSSLPDDTVQITNTAAIADDGSHGFDLDPSDNTFTTTTTVVQPLPADLVIESLSVLPATVHLGEALTVEVQVKNQGAGDVRSPFASGWYRNLPGAPVSVTLPTGSWRVDELAAGNTVTLSYSYRPASVGTSQIYAYADATWATATVAVDDAYTLTVNCQPVGHGDNFQAALSHDITPFLRDGRNVIAIEGRNEGGPGGVLFEADLPGGQQLVSNGTWRYNIAEQPGWCNPEFDDTAWLLASDYGGWGSPAWGANPPEMASTTAHWIWAAIQRGRCLSAPGGRCLLQTVGHDQRNERDQ